MSLLIKALDKAQAAKALEAKSQEAKSQEAKAQDLKGKAEIKQVEAKQAEIKQAEKALQAYSDNAKRKPQVLESNTPAVNAASVKLAAGNALEMELSPIANNSAANQKSDIAQNKSDNDRVASPFQSQVKSQVKSPQSPAIHQISTANNPASSSKASAKSAANVFAAKRIESNNKNTILLLMAGVSLCVLLAIAAYFYLFLDRAPDFSPSSSQNFSAVKPVAPLPEKSASVLDSTASNAQVTPNQPTVESSSESNSAPLVTEPTIAQANQTTAQAEKSPINAPKSAAFREESLTENEVVQNPVLVEKTPGNRLAQVNRDAFEEREPRTIGQEQIASKSASIQVSKTKPLMAVNPTLMDAFNAYNAGNDVVASKLYRQVLQRDVHNVDALLGLGAIAQRQGRIADANGWYAKVLEVEPRNTLATSAILDSQPQSDAANNESRIKNMLAKQPDDANLHATLGNFYADLNQWPAAQQAYFDAYNLNASADNAFNLAVSLDQMGKPKLALPYYQKALQLAQSGNSKIDKIALEARIAAIQ